MSIGTLRRAYHASPCYAVASKRIHSSHSRDGPESCHTTHSVHAVHAVHTIHTVHAVHAVHAVHRHSAHTIQSSYAWSYWRTRLRSCNVSDGSTSMVGA